MSAASLPPKNERKHKKVRWKSFSAPSDRTGTHERFNGAVGMVDANEFDTEKPSKVFPDTFISAVHREDPFPALRNKNCPPISTTCSRESAFKF
jgi:hypothetical protein